MAEAALSGWRRPGRRPVVIGIGAVVVLVLIGGAAAWATDGGGASGYRTTTVVHASVAQHLDVVGTVDPVSDASAAFQVGGTVTSVDAVVGAQVTAGQTLATLDGTSLTQAVSSAQSSLASDEAKLTEDEDSQTSGSGATSNTSTTTTTAPAAGSRSPASTGSATGPIAQDQATLVADQKKESADQQTEAADLKQADTVCGLTATPPSPPADPAGCAAALAQVSADEQAVSSDQQAVGRDETTLATALTAEQSASSNGSAPATAAITSDPATTSSTASAAAADLASTTSTGTSGSSDSNLKSGDSSPAATGTSGASAASDSAQQIATDQAAIDTAQSDLIVAQQALLAAQLTSPITGTVASVGLSVGDTVSADSSTAVIVIIGTDSFEVAATLTSSQVSSVKVGYPAQVAVDGTNGTFQGTVSQVGPVQAGSSGYSYPVVVLLPSSATGLFSGSTADMSIQTSRATDVLAVATSAVQTQGTRSYVLEMAAGGPVRKVVKVGIVGGIYTQVLSGVARGDTVVLADLSAPVPASSTTSIGGFGGFGGFGGAGGPGGFGGGGGRFTQKAAVAGSPAG